MLTINDFREKTGIAITTNHKDKMQDMYSLSTACTCNEHCKKRAAVKGCICNKCYAMTMNKRFSNLNKMLENNADILTTRILSNDEMPYINAPLGMFRLEAFGDLINEIQVVNYFNIVKANPHCDCALWTKNPWIIASAIEKFNLVKPENLRIIGSSYMINNPMEKYFKQFDFIDNIFTVYTKDYVQTNNINITCGGRSCKSCQKCYRGSHSEYEIKELLK